MTPQQTTPKTNASGTSGRVRTCVGCGKHDAPEALVRVVIAASAPSSVQGAGEKGAGLVVDFAGGSFGRGAHVHPAPKCIAGACRGGFSKAFKQRVDATPESFAELVRAAAERRAEGLLLGARRAGHLALGADAAAAALATGADLLVVAADAGSIATRAPFARAVADGRAVVIFDKARLGALLGREEIAVAAVTHAGIGAELRRVRVFSDTARSVAWSSREVQ
jgi:predicted RNA-binding protein YlxR (DUF448 family)